LNTQILLSGAKNNFSTLARDDVNFQSLEKIPLPYQTPTRPFDFPDSDFTVLRGGNSNRKFNVELETPMNTSSDVDGNSNEVQTTYASVTQKKVITTVQNFSDHVLFCSLAKSFPKNLAYFVAAYRASDATSLIVILCPDSPDDNQRRLLEEYGNIMFI
jgi:hypothetical protein